MKKFITTIILGLSFLVMAQPMAAEEEGSMPPECRFIVKHTPEKGVAFTPGVDLKGKAVVPADINASPFELPDVVQVPISIDLIERIRNAPEQFSGVEAEADYGVLEIHKDGRILYDGQDWGDPVRAACGHKAEDAISSPPPVEDIGTPVQGALEPIVKDVLIEGGEYREEGYK
jgi:hypothetical protein